MPLIPCWQGGQTERVALHALGPPPPCMVVETEEMAAALIAKPSTAVCFDSCAGGTCIDGHTWTFVLAAILATMAPAIANHYTNSTQGMVADMGGGAGGEMLWLHQAMHLLQWPVQWRWVMHPPLEATCKVCMGTLCPTSSWRRSSMELTFD